MTDTYYHFISSGRQGLAAAIDTDLDLGQKRASIEVLLNVARKSKTTGDWVENDPDPIQRTVQLYGPGDVLGFDERIVVRTDPKPDSGNFEPNYFPLIEFADFDFPWRYSPEQADDKGLTPWIVLIALIAEGQKKEYEQVARGKDQLPAIKVFDQANLPDLTCAWRWAHVQATSGEETLNEDQLREIYENQPECLVSRLLCPRRLQPKTLYTAFVVPAFKLGWAAGLGDEITRSSVIESTANDPAWGNQAGESIELPYYYRWDFRTSLRGDFEHLVRLLEPRELEDLGLRKMDCQHPGFGLCVQRPDSEDGEEHILDLEGALQSCGTGYTSWGKDSNGPLDLLEPDEYPEPEVFQQRLAVEVLDKVNAKSLIRSCKVNPAISAAEGIRAIHSAGSETVSDEENDVNIKSIIKEVSKGISFNLLPDGKSVRVTWRTPVNTSGSISYGVEKPQRKVTYDHISRSDTYVRRHSVIITLVPEKIYWLKLRIFNKEMGIDFEAITASICIPLPAVVPPIYGRWHAARSTVAVNKDANAWLDVLNLDPRHRAAAGLGAQVVRKQQEALMSSAWDQIGDFETANDILRRAQLGRESCNFLHDRLGSMALEDYLRATAPVQKRILRRQNGGPKRTILAELKKTTLIPPAALDPAFRRISRRRGPIRKRQKQHRMDLLRRMALGELQPAGEPPKILGTKTPCAITEDMILNVVPTISLNVDNIQFDGFTEDGAKFTFTLNWEAKKIIGQLTASGDWAGDKEQQGPDTFSAAKMPTTNGIIIIDSSTLMDDSVESGNSLTPPDTEGTELGPVTFTFSAAKMPTTNGIIIIDSSTLMDDSVESGNSLTPPDTEGTELGPVTFTFLLTGESFANQRTTSLEVTINAYSNPVLATIAVTSGEPELKTIVIDDSAMRFCDERITCDDIRDALKDGENGITIEDDLLDAICDTFSNFLIPEDELDRPPTRDQSYFEDLRNTIHNAIDPRKTIVERVKKRLKLTDGLAIRFEEDAKGDPLDGIMAYPVFPQPMYEPLRDLSESHILPGVEKVPQNTVCVLETNRRFLESYMVGLNHEFSAELLWRGFPTDQRGSYFRQFWDVREQIDTSASRFGAGQTEAEERLKDILPLTKWKDSRLGENDTRSIDGANSNENDHRAVLVIRGDLFKRYPNAVIYAVNARLEYEDNIPTGNFIPDLEEFRSQPASEAGSGSTTTSPAGGIRYANMGERKTTITGRVANLPFLNLESLPPDPGHSDPIAPTFRGSLGADLVFFGFPFSVEEAKSSPGTTGKFFVFEERVTETRFGLDLQESDETISNWDNLSWEDFGLVDKPGAYLDSSPIDHITLEDAEDGEPEIWNENTSAALRARITMQKPVRLAIHADQMIP